MEHTTLFVLMATIVSFFFATIWNRRDIPNTLIKMLFWAMALWGLLETLQLNGYIVQV